MLKIALLLLTTMQDGSVRVTLSDAEDLTECEAGRDAVTAILTDAGNPPIAAICGETDLRLSPFVHGVPEDQETNRYRVEILAGERFVITPLAEGEDCVESKGADSRIWCARSVQAVIDGDA